MIAALPHENLPLDYPAPAVAAGQDPVPIVYPPIMEICQAQAVPSTCEYPVCLVTDAVYCGYRLSHRNLGQYCLHPLHAKIVERTRAAHGSGSGMC